MCAVEDTYILLCAARHVLLCPAATLYTKYLYTHAAGSPITHCVASYVYKYYIYIYAYNRWTTNEIRNRVTVRYTAVIEGFLNRQEMYIRAHTINVGTNTQVSS